MLQIARSFDPSLELKYNKFYIGLARDGQPYNFVAFRPRKKTINVEIGLPRTTETDAQIEAAGIETLEYATRWRRYRLSLDKDAMAKQRDLLRELFGRAYQERAE